MLHRDLAIPAVIGLGLYANANNLNLANNTTALIELFLLFSQQKEIDRLNAAIFGEHLLYGAPFNTPYGTPYGVPYGIPRTTGCRYSV
jgi:hypothetical protein